MSQDVRVNELLKILMIIWQLSGTTRAENWSNPTNLEVNTSILLLLSQGASALGAVLQSQ